MLDLYNFLRNDLLDYEIKSELLKCRNKILSKKLVIQSIEIILRQKFALIGGLQLEEERKQESLEKRIQGSLKKWKFLSLPDKNIINEKIYESRQCRYMKIEMKIEILFRDIMLLQDKLKNLTI